jgi:hypothetical protein
VNVLPVKSPTTVLMVSPSVASTRIIGMVTPHAAESPNSSEHRDHRGARTDRGHDDEEQDRGDHGRFDDAGARRATASRIGRFDIEGRSARSRSSCARHQHPRRQWFVRAGATSTVPTPRSANDLRDEHENLLEGRRAWHPSNAGLSVHTGLVVDARVSKSRLPGHSGHSGDAHEWAVGDRFRFVFGC